MRSALEQLRNAIYSPGEAVVFMYDSKEETLRAGFLAGPQIQPVLQHAQREASPVPQDHAEQQER